MACFSKLKHALSLLLSFLGEISINQGVTIKKNDGVVCFYKKSYKNSGFLMENSYY